MSGDPGQTEADQVPGEAETAWPAGTSSTGTALVALVEDLPDEDFRIEDDRFERDARLGRELLFLLSNNDWARRTTEVIDIERVRAVDAEIVIDVDLSLIQHEAFRPAHDGVCLPVLALPADRPTGGGRRGEVDRDVRDPITSLEVTDAAGDRVTKVPQADVHHWLAAVLAETLLRRPRLPGTEGPVGTERPAAVDQRDQVVLLAASIRRLLQKTLGGSEVAEPVRRPSSRDGSSPRASRLRRFEGRASVARAALLEVFRRDLSQRRPVTSRVIEILDALIGTVLVVVPIGLASAPTSFAVRLPSRKLIREPLSRWRLRPRARLQVDLLMATTHADRLIRLNLPPSVTWAASEDRGPPDAARIEVLTPLPFDQLRTLTHQLVDSTDAPITWVDQQIAEVAIEKTDACLESLRFYEPDGGRDEPLAARLLDLRTRLRDVVGSSSSRGGPALTAEQAAAPREALRLLWDDGGWLPRRLRRRLVVNVASPDAVQVRSPAVEDFTQRSEPTAARLDLDVRVIDSPVLDSARDTNVINLFLLAAVMALLLWHNGSEAGKFDVEVLATVLTLFPVIQASRIDRPDVTTLAGLLTQPGYWLNLVSAVPATLLAATMAVVPQGMAGFAAVAAFLVQLFLHLLIVWQISGGRQRPAAARFILATHHAPDHQPFDVIRSTWCRTLSSDALTFGRSVHASIVLGSDRPRSLPELLKATRKGDPLANMLAVFGMAAAGYALTMVVVRDGAGATNLSAVPALVRPVPLDLAQLVPPDPPEWIVEVLIGIPAAQADDLVLESHPVTAIVSAARVNYYRTLLVQYPCGPPPDDRVGCRWMRVRVGVPYRRDDSLNGFRRFLTALGELQDEGRQMKVRVLPAMATLEATETAPEEAFQGFTPLAGTRPLLQNELEAPPLGEGVWRPIALCAEARVGMASDSLTSLTQIRPGMRLAAMSSAVVHGMSMMLLLCHDTEPEGPVPLGKLVAADLSSPTNQVFAPVDGRPMPVPSARMRLSGRRPSSWGGAPARPGPLLLVQIRAADRPGVLHELLGQLDQAVAEQALRLGVRTNGLDVWTVLVRVIDGRALQGRMTLRLPSDEADGVAARGWDGVDWTRLLRRLREVHQLDETAVLRMDLLRAPRGAAGS